MKILFDMVPSLTSMAVLSFVRDDFTSVSLFAAAAQACMLAKL